jgi:hypothetical protein
MDSKLPLLAGLCLLLPLLIATASRAAAPSDSSRYFGGLLDERSTYGSFWFPEPLRAPEMDVDSELRVDYFHGETSDNQQTRVTAEIEHNIGLLTFEIEVPYERESESTLDPTTGRITHDVQEGLANIELAARHPVFQLVSPDERVDYTLVAAFEVAVPTKTRISHDTEVVPQLFQLLRLGDRLSIQASAGYSALIGPVDGGTNTLEYNVVFGWNLEHEDVPVPGLDRIVPIFELNGERGFTGADQGINRLFGTAGARFNLKPIGIAQPRLGIGYVFPIDAGARAELDWGIVTSVVFEF